MEKHPVFIYKKEHDLDARQGRWIGHMTKDVKKKNGLVDIFRVVFLSLVSLGIVTFRVLRISVYLHNFSFCIKIKAETRLELWLFFFNIFFQAKRSVCGTSCSVCLQRKPRDEMKALLCSHFFCKDCWCKQFEVLINNGIASGEPSRPLWQKLLRQLHYLSDSGRRVGDVQYGGGWGMCGGGWGMYVQICSYFHLSVCLHLSVIVIIIYTLQCISRFTEPISKVLH